MKVMWCLKENSTLLEKAHTLVSCLVFLILFSILFYNSNRKHNIRSNISVSQKKLVDLEKKLSLFVSKATQIEKRTDEIIYSSCTAYEESAKLKRYVMLRIWKNHIAVNLNDITLILQLSLSRFYLIDLHIKQWSGPMSIVIHVQFNELKTLKKSIMFSDAIFYRNNIDIHFVLAKGVSKYIFYIINIFDMKQLFCASYHQVMKVISFRNYILLIF